MANGAVSLNELNLALGRHRSTKWQPSDQTSQAGRKNHPRPKLLLEFGMVLFLAAIDHLRRGRYVNAAVTDEPAEPVILSSGRSGLCRVRLDFQLAHYQ